MNSFYGKMSTFISVIFITAFYCGLLCDRGLMSLLDNGVASKTGYYILKGIHVTKIGALQCVFFKNDNMMLWFSTNSLIKQKRWPFSCNNDCICHRCLSLTCMQAPKHILGPVRPCGWPYPLLFNHVIQFYLKTKKTVNHFSCLSFFLCLY